VGFVKPNDYCASLVVLQMTALRLPFVTGKSAALQRPKELVYMWSWCR